MTHFADMLTAALYAMLLQNLVFTAAYGISESIKIAKRPKYFITSSITVGFFTTMISVICFFVEKIPFMGSLNIVAHYMVYVVILSCVYLVAGGLCIVVLKANKKFMNSLGMCAFNSLVLSVPALNFKANHTLPEALGTGIGAGLAFALSVLLINAGIRHIASNKNIPEFFKGTPAIVVYVAVLSLALSCFSGEALFV